MTILIPLLREIKTMDSIHTVSLSRSKSLFDELSIVANNIANAGVDGFRADRVLFTEHIETLDGDRESISLANVGAFFVDLSQGSLKATGGLLDFAIEGEGFFQVDTENGPRLTRSGSFVLSPEGALVTAQGYRLLGEGGAEIIVPPDAAEISLASDGSLSVLGNPIGRVELVTAQAENLQREGDTLFRVKDNEFLPLETATLVQGFIEASNVNPVVEMTRLIEVQRAYETIQTLDRQGESRFRNLVDAIEQPR